jgi:hypothetical protein
VGFLEFVSKVIESLAWPAVAAWAIYLFQEPLKSLIGRVSKINFPGGWGAEFLNALARVEEAADAIQPQTRKKLSAPTDPRLDSLRKLSRTDPAAAINDAWQAIERAVAEVAPPDKGFRTPSGLVKLVKDEGFLDGVNLVLIEDLRVLRSRTAHDKSVTLSPEEAYSFCVVAIRIADMIRQIGNRRPANAIEPGSSEHPDVDAQRERSIENDEGI